MKVQLQEDSLDLTVVIPTLNEGPNLDKLLPILRTTLEEIGVNWEILIVDGNSQDGTQEIAAREHVHYICEDEPGYGAAILRGFSEALGTYILTMDADLSHPAPMVTELWAVRDHADISIASRYVPGGQADQPWVRLQLSRILNIFFRKGFSIDVLDMSSGFRLYRKNILGHLDLEFTNIVVLIELLLKSRPRGYRIQEIPFQYKPRSTGSSKAQVIKFGFDYLRLFRRIWKIRKAVDFPDYD